MKKLTTPFLLSLCALTMLSSCAKDHNDQNVGIDPIVNPNDDINLPDERGPDRQLNIRMIRAGLNESNEVRQRRGLAPLAYDQNLTILAQRRAREIHSGNSGNGQWQDPQHMSAGADGIPGSGHREQDDRDSHDWQGSRDGRDGRGNDHHFPGQPDYGYAAEISISGYRDARPAYRQFSTSPSTYTHLLSPLYRRHGVGYSNGTWVEVFAY